MVMGLLRAAADVVIVGAGTLAVDRHHLWTAEGIFPGLADLARSRNARQRTEPPGYFAYVSSWKMLVQNAGLLNLRSKLERRAARLLLYFPIR
jgi:hypothetical protein